MTLRSVTYDDRLTRGTYTDSDDTANYQANFAPPPPKKKNIKKSITTNTHKNQK